jgi:glycosyltransferase involved in cell wall biosynthesis
MSSEVMEDLRKLTAKPALRLHHPLYDNYGEGIGREEALGKLALPADKKYALFFGFIRKYKGLDILLEAMADDRVKSEDIHLIVAGEYYGDRELYERIIAKHKLQNRIHLFTDFIPNEEVKVYFSAADCIALTYRSATQSGITQVAYHFERGMVATRVGGLPEGVKDGKTGILCEPDVRSVAEALVAYFSPGTLPNLQEELKKQKALYSWKAFAEAIIAFSGEHNS